MHLTREEVKAAVMGAVSDINASLPADKHVEVAGSADAFAGLDSLASLNLLLRIEERLADLSDAEGCDLVGGDGDDFALLRARTVDDLTAAVAAALERSAP